tara:strand:- start:3799 stop:5340 length:1542 start_codon:yes stop_codon:yes gene_type:complete
MKLLDCTLRDGGYYTNWDFDQKLVDEYANAMENLPIDYVEVGYRSVKLDGYLGKYFYCPLFVLKHLKERMPTKKLVVILNEKDIRVEHLDELLEPIKPYVTLIRIALDPINFKRAISLARFIKEMGFEVAFNVMYMSQWSTDSAFLDLLEEVEDYLDYFYMVDSFGGILPNDLKEIIQLVKSKTKLPLGFHGHDNLEMALINTITAIDEGCVIADSTITGMGRGAGNLKTELFLTFLASKNKLKLNYNMLSSIVSAFDNLRKQYGWGTSLPYMFSGAHSLPQKQVMEWVGLNRYSLSSILHALNNKKMLIDDNIKLPVLEKEKVYDSAIIIGGGESSKAHKEAIAKYLYNRENICLIHAGVKNIRNYLDLDCNQIYALVGVETDALLRQIDHGKNVSNACIFPPFPRKMGISMSSRIEEVSKELEIIEFTQISNDSPLVIAIQTAFDLGARSIYLVGFDGYDISINKNQFSLAQENQRIIDDVSNNNMMSITSLTPTRYHNIKLTSIYSLLEI